LRNWTSLLPWFRPRYVALEPNTVWNRFRYDLLRGLAALPETVYFWLCYGLPVLFYLVCPGKWKSRLIQREGGLLREAVGSLYAYVAPRTFRRVFWGSEGMNAYYWALRRETKEHALYKEPFWNAFTIAVRCHKISRILDVGCSGARSLRVQAQRNPDLRFLGVDLSVDVARYAAEKARAEGLASMEILQGDFCDPVQRSEILELLRPDAVVMQGTAEFFTPGELRAVFCALRKAEVRLLGFFEPLTEKTRSMALGGRSGWWGRYILDLDDPRPRNWSRSRGGSGAWSHNYPLYGREAGYRELCCVLRPSVYQASCTEMIWIGTLRPSSVGT
jgi:SAM-dependent methyltransferase